MSRPLSALLAVVCTFGPSVAFAHTDPNGDGNRYSPTRCDTYYRDGHYGSSSTPKGSRHSEDHSSEFDDEAGPVTVHNHTGHYVVRSDAFYVEVVGGGGYNRDDNQGGFVQGEVDPVAGGPDVDFHSGAYAGTSGDRHSENACISAADQKIGESGVQDTGKNGTFCVVDPTRPSCTFTAFEDGLRVYTEFASGFRVTIKRAGATIKEHTVRDASANASLSFAMTAGDVVTCTLLPGAAPQPVGRLSCSG